MSGVDAGAHPGLGAALAAVLTRTGARMARLLDGRTSAVMTTAGPDAARDTGVAVLAADTDEEASRLALPNALQFLRLRQGNPGLVPTPDEAAAYPYTDEERFFVEDRLRSQIIGSPGTVRDGVRELVDRTGVDELMVVTSAHDGADRLRSYELLAKAVAPATV